MIKINLLGVAPPPTKMMSAPGGPPAPTTTLVVVFVGAMVICFGIVGIIYKVWSNQVTDLQKSRDHEKVRAAELASVRAQNDKYQQRLKDLETRINTIQALQNNRVGPVELMSSLGNVVSKTNDIYLYTLQPAGGKVQLKGQSDSVDSMASFIAFLKSSGFYDNIQLDQFYQDDQHERLAYKFALTCDFKPSTGGASPTAGAAPSLPAGMGVPPAGAAPNGAAPIPQQPGQIGQRYQLPPPGAPPASGQPGTANQYPQRLVR
jgi:Tfp pilus assembly protein PilN